MQQAVGFLAFASWEKKLLFKLHQTGAPAGSSNAAGVWKDSLRLTGAPVWSFFMLTQKWFLSETQEGEAAQLITSSYFHAATRCQMHHLKMDSKGKLLPSSCGDESKA